MNSKIYPLMASLSMVSGYACTPDKIPSDGFLKLGVWEGHQQLETVTFGIVPQQSPYDIEQNWGPLVSYLEEETGLSILIKTASSIPMFEKRCEEGRYDFAYMNPYHYVVLSETSGYEAVAKQKDKQIQGIIVMRKEDNNTPLSDLKNQQLAFPSPAAFGASLLTRAHLNNEGIPFEPVYVRSHDSVYRAVASGLYPAGGGVKRTLKSMPPEVQDKLNIAWTTEKYTPHALASHQRVSEETIQAVQMALRKLNDPTEFSEFLQPIRFKGWEVAVDEDWNDVRDLGLNALMGERK
jgi:phosphonate transport system substrate-binding protein